MITTGAGKAAPRPGLGAILASPGVFSILFWGASFVATRVALEGFTPAGLVAARFLLGGAVVALVAGLRRTKPWPLREDRARSLLLRPRARRAHPHAGVRAAAHLGDPLGLDRVLGQCASGLAFFCWAATIERFGALRAGLLIYLQPFVTLSLSLGLLHESVGWSTLLGGPVVLLGVALAARR
ncbi:MAG: DMT family transporter [Planctomycetes bacterium]|nr:DMT family transporter [Planctomycetota bacterium]